MIEVQFNRGLFLPEAELWLDPWEAKPHAFVSHAHADHFARHESCLCSEATAHLIRRRFNLAEDRLEALPFSVPIVRNGFRLRLLSAGHIIGSAMLHVTRLRDQATLLYTGDFKTRRGRTAEPVCFQNADTLIMETTFGLPQFAFPPALEIESSILRFVHDAFADGEVPVLFGYSLGKAQEALALLAEHDIPALLHPNVAEMTAACREVGANLPEPILFEGFAKPGHAIIAPPNAIRSKALRGLKNKRTAMLTGWALQGGAKYRYRVDEVFPLSDHADHPALMECVQRVRPKRVLTVHGYAREFATELRTKRIDAWCAMGGDQLELPMAATNQRAPLGQGFARQSRPICAFADFSDVCRLVGETSSRLAKIEFLSNYLRTRESDDDLRLAARWLTGHTLAATAPRRQLQIGSAAIRRALLSLPGAKEERYRDISLAQNDSARTARLFMQELTLRPEPLDLAGADAFFHELALAPGSLARIELLANRLKSLHPAEGETLVKLLSGDLRIGLKEGLVEDAVAAAFEAEPSAVRHAHMLTGDAGETAVLARYQKLEEAVLTPFVPVKAMLASPSQTSEEVWQWHCSHAAGPLWIEPKYDGIRLQLHKRGGRVSVYSRDLLPMDESFPDLIEAAQRLPFDCVLDGELVAYAEGRRLGFNDLQQRLGRRHEHDLFNTDPAHELSVPLRFVAFDILWHAGESLLDLSLIERRIRLDALDLQEPFGRIAVAQVNSADLLEAAFKESLGSGYEGLIAKDPSSLYHPGRRGKAWLKLKGVMPTLDCVVVAAEQGHGKRADVLSDYTFALRDEQTGDLKVLGKAYSGLTDEEIEDLTEHFRRHTLRKERRKYHVEPNLVLEIAFDSIRQSDRHDSGLALRFPRIKAIRRDKSVAEIDTLQYAQGLVALG